MADREYLRLNEESLGRLRSLVARLSAEDYARPVGGGWTVASVFGHMGFWDRWQAARWRDMLAGTGVGPDDDILAAEPFANEALEAYWGIAGSPETGPMAADAAEQLDAVIAAAPHEMARRLDGTPNVYLLRRHRHRNEHLDQIERELGR